MAYTPPAKDAANGFFSEAYTPPAKDAVDGNITSGGVPQTVFDTGFEATEFGATTARWNQYPFIEGNDFLSFSASRIYPYASQSCNFTQAYIAPLPSPLNIDFAVPYGTVAPAGFDGSAHGMPSIAYDADFLLPSGWLDDGYGTPTMAARVRFTGFDELGVGLPQDADHFVRYRYFDGISALAFGTHVIGTRQYVYAFGSTHTQFGTTTVGRDVAYDVQGFDSSVFGTPVIDYVRVLPTGFVTLGFDEPVVRNQKAFVYPFGLSSLVFGSAQIRSSRTYVLPPSLINSEGVDGSTAAYGQGWTITGPDGPVAPLGLDYLRFGYTSIANTSRALVPGGVSSLEIGEQTVTHWVQEVYPTGALTFQGPSLLLQVRNAAIAAYPSGFDSLSPINIVDIKDAKQTAYVFYPGDFAAHTEWGETTFVAYRVRTLTVYAPPEPPQPVPRPLVYLNKIVLGDIDSLRTGLPYVESKFNRVTPAGLSPPDMLHLHEIRNRNREQPMFGETYTEYGRPFVWTNKLEVSGADYLSFPKHTIADRTQVVAPYHWLSQQIPWPVVRLDPEPPIAQVIYALGFVSLGIDDETAITNNTIQPTGLSSFEAGDDHEVILMGARTTGWLSLLVGKPVVVFDQIVRPSGIEPIDATFIGEPHLWPHYITAPDPARPVDFEIVPPPGVGLDTIIEHRHRTVAPGFLATTLFGAPVVQLRERRVYPSGLSSFRYGLPRMGGGSSSYEAAKGVVHFASGTPSIAHIVPYSPYVYPTGASMTEFGGTDIMLRHRSVYPSGFDALWPGQPTGPSSGVYYTPLAYDVQGFDATLWGEETFIAHRIRSVYMNGFDGFNQKPVFPFHNQSQFSKTPAGISPVHALR